MRQLLAFSILTTTVTIAGCADGGRLLAPTAPTGVTSPAQPAGAGVMQARTRQPVSLGRSVAAQSAFGTVEGQGTVSAVVEACPTPQFVIEGITVTTSASTVFQNGTCASVQPGVRLHVKGVLESNGTVTATRIVVVGPAGPTGPGGDEGEDEEDDGGNGGPTGGRREVEGEGTVASTLDACPTVTFVVNGITVLTEAQTEYREGTCDDLVPGARVQVKGVRQADGRVRATRIMFKRQRQEVEGDVTVDSVAGTCPDLVIVAGPVTVATDESTEFRPSCSAVLPGSRVQIKGFRQPDGTFLATRIVRKQSKPGPGVGNESGDPLD